MKNILLLGGWGFVGTNILAFSERKQLPFRFIVMDRTKFHPYGHSFSNVEKSYAGDFSDSAFLQNIFDDNNIDCVFHSISTTIPTSSVNAIYDVESNLMSTIRLLDIMTSKHVSDIVFISSGGAVYGSQICEDGGHKETDDLFPISSYGVVKLTIEKYLFQYSYAYGLNPLILRLSNPYGPFHYSERQGICNIALRRALHNEPFTVWGDGSAIKDYIYVEDVCVIIFLLLQNHVSKCILNVGSGQLLSVNDILRQVKLLVPSFSWNYKDPVKFDVPRVELNTDKLKEKLGINYPFHRFEDVLPLLIKS